MKLKLILVNVGSAWILLRQRENSYSSLQRSLFTYQAVMDILYLVSPTYLPAWSYCYQSHCQISTWLMFSLPELSPHYREETLPHLMPHLFPLMNILLTGGLLNLLCVSLTVDGGPGTDHGQHRGSVFALARYILPSAVFAAVSNIPKFLLMKTVHYEGLVAR